jgi:hypothetical protein
VTTEELLPNFYNNDGYEVRLHVNDIIGTVERKALEMALDFY